MRNAGGGFGVLTRSGSTGSKATVALGNSSVRTDNPLPQQTAWHGRRRWSAVLGLTAAVAMGSPVVACGTHDHTVPNSTSVTTTTTTDTTPAPGGAAPGATVTQSATPSQPIYVQPPYQAPGDYSPFGGRLDRPR